MISEISDIKKKETDDKEEESLTSSKALRTPVETSDKKLDKFVRIDLKTSDGNEELHAERNVLCNKKDLIVLQSKGFSSREEKANCNNSVLLANSSILSEMAESTEKSRDMKLKRIENENDLLLSENSEMESSTFTECLMETESCDVIKNEINVVKISQDNTMFIECVIDENGILRKQSETLLDRSDDENNDEESSFKLENVLREGSNKVNEYSLVEVYVNNDSNFEEKEVLLTAERPFYCDVCGLTFKRKDHVRSHKRWVHLGVRNKDFKCEKCGKMLKSNDGLEQHMRRHLNLKPFQCKDCSMAFFSRRCLLKHSKIHYNTPLPVEDGIYRCCECSNKYNSEKDLHSHINWHQLPLVCDICFERFEFMKQLLCHKRVHITYHPYKCDVCSESFRQNRSLQAHMLKCHLNHEKKLKSKLVKEAVCSKYCQVCNKTFSSLATFYKHTSICKRAIHSKLENFFCSTCQIGFKKEDSYADHMLCHNISQDLCNVSEIVTLNIISDLNSS